MLAEGQRERVKGDFERGSASDMIRRQLEQKLAQRDRFRFPEEIEAEYVRTSQNIVRLKAEREGRSVTDTVIAAEGARAREAFRGNVEAATAREQSQELVNDPAKRWENRTGIGYKVADTPEIVNERQRLKEDAKYYSDNRNRATEMGVLRKVEEKLLIEHHLKEFENGATPEMVSRMKQLAQTGEIGSREIARARENRNHGQETERELERYRKAVAARGEEMFGNPPLCERRHAHCKAIAEGVSEEELLRKDYPAVSAEQGKRMAEDYATRAVAVYREALADGYRGLSDLKKTTDKLVIRQDDPEKERQADLQPGWERAKQQATDPNHQPPLERLGGQRTGGPGRQENVVPKL